MLVRAAIAVLAAGACGRINYDPLANGDGGGEVDARPGAPDAAPPDASCPGTTVADYCATLPPLPAPPVIDGVLDCGLELHTMVPVGWQPFMGAPIPADFAARYAVAWRPDGLYYYLDVDDASRVPAEPVSGMLYCGDAPEIYVDHDGVFENPPDYDDPGTRQVIFRPPDGEVTPSMVADVYRFMVLLGPWGSPRFGVWPRPGGYVLEAFVVASDLGLAAWSLGPGAQVGFDLSVNVSQPDQRMGDCGYRVGQLFLHVDDPGPGCDLPYCDVEAFCTPVLRN